MAILLSLLKRIFSGSYAWDLDESGSPESQQLATRSAKNKQTIYGKVNGQPATAYRGQTYLRGERLLEGHKETRNRVSQHLDE